MELNTDVLIVGAGPTGLMMACQLARFGVSCRIIDKQIDRVKESRAFGIQAKSMEIFQNLGIASEFLKQEVIGTKARFYFHGKFRFEINFANVATKDNTPFPAIYFLSQSITEQILLEYLAQKNIHVERQTELIAFTREDTAMVAEIKNNITGKHEKQRCHYIVGCDGAHSTVREVLGIAFSGASYQQEFVLADVAVKWPLSKDNFTVFISKEGNFLFIPLKKDENLNRLIITGMKSSVSQSSNAPPTLQELENFAKRITRTDIQLTNPVWISRFYLHHRFVQQYQKHNAFIAGDAAHIHTPVGAQGMNTGLQDVTNLAWKIAFVLKYNAPQTLLETYQTERQRIGEILVNTTDKIFGLITKKNLFVYLLRQHVMPIVMSFLTKSGKFNEYLFHFISELGVRYHKSLFVQEKTDGADSKFLSGPEAGCRAPDAPIYNSTLFEIFRNKPCNILIFRLNQYSQLEHETMPLEQINPDIIAVHKFIRTPELAVLFERYGITAAGVYFIRPDGYIGFRAYGEKLESLLEYLAELFGRQKNC